MLIDLNEDTLQDLISKNEKVVVQFSASWCVVIVHNETKI
jgi:thiol:disulfide interchange protein